MRWRRRRMTDMERKTFCAALSRYGAQAQEIDALRNELCLKCGNYTLAHEGACNGCRWRR
nr:MAG TPA: putative tRNA pseudouridine synthase B [Caudoviricetes sp.]